MHSFPQMQLRTCNIGLIFLCFRAYKTNFLAIHTTFVGSSTRSTKPMLGCFKTTPTSPAATMAPPPSSTQCASTSSRYICLSSVTLSAICPITLGPRVLNSSSLAVIAIASFVPSPTFTSASNFLWSPLPSLYQKQRPVQLARRLPCGGALRDILHLKNKQPFIRAN